MISWGKDPDYDAMAEEDGRITWFDVVIWVAIASIGWATLAIIAYFIWDAFQ